MTKGILISFEGIDRCGKSTQAQLLAERIGEPALLIREPGGTPTSEEIRTLLLDRQVRIDPATETLLYAAARAQLVAEIIRPALVEGKIVICDRYIDSSLAYQGVARGLGIEMVESINRPAIADLWPDRTFLLTVDPELAAERSGSSDRLEAEGVGFQRTVSSGFDQVLERYPGRIVRVDGSKSSEEVAESIWQSVGELVGDSR